MASTNPVVRPVEWDARAIVRATVSVLAVALGFAFVARFSTAILGWFVAIVLAAGLLPLIDALERRRVPRALGATVAFVLVSLMAAGLVITCLPLILERGQSFVARIPTYQLALRARALTSSSVTLRRLVEQMPQGGALELPSAGIDSVTRGLGSFARVVAMAGAVVLFGYYWAVRGPATVRLLLLIAPRARRAELAEFIAVGQTQLGAFVRGQLLVCAAVGALAFCSYTIIRLPDALVLALLAALLEVVPMVGPLLGALPAVLVALAISPSRALWVIGAAIAIHLLENLVLVPRVMRRAVGVHPALSLLAVAAMGSLLGLPGALLAVPSAAIAQLAVDRFLYRRRAVREARQQLTSLRERLGALVNETDSQERTSRTERVLCVRARDLALDFDRLLDERTRE